ncbi:MAG: T9SS type A sorting domain-containing protein [Bacteroidota bacterium]
MKPRIMLPGFHFLLIGMLLPALLSAQRGDIAIPTTASISVPLNAQICADRIFANNPGYGTLTLADPAGICAGTAVTPVELMLFSAALQNDVVVLSWTTETETRNYGFEVQRKAESGTWSTLGFTPGSGSTTGTKSYAFTDVLEGLAASCRRLRYRLKQIDLDGKHEYSPEVEVLLEQPLPLFSVEGYPSPADESFTIRLMLGEASATSLRLFDISGRVVMIIAQDLMLQTGNHSMRVRIAEVPSGLYFLVAENKSGRKSGKVLIRH